MNTATGNLENDHIFILKLTDVMKAVTLSERPDVKLIEDIIDIIKNFADGLHHAKEENILFPALENKGFSSKQGPVAVMIHEHVQGRNFVKGMSDNLDLFKKGDDAAISDIYRNMAGYADLLFNHINKENNILFKMADNVLSVSEQAELLEKFEHVEQNRASGSMRSDYIERINNLAGYYKI